MANIAPHMISSLGNSIVVIYVDGTSRIIEIEFVCVSIMHVCVLKVCLVSSVINQYVIGSGVV